MLDKTFQARQIELKNSIRAKYSAELSVASMIGKFIIHYRIQREFNREWKKAAPSFHTLY
jgi:hypothetical protein